MENKIMENEGYFKKGNYQAYLEKYDEAILSYTKAIELNNEFEASYHNRGIIYAKQEEYEKALEDFNKAIEINSKYANAYHNRGFVKKILKIKDYEDDLEEAILLKLKENCKNEEYDLTIKKKEKEQKEKKIKKFIIIGSLVLIFLIILFRIIYVINQIQY
jgi:tetratricopeptide (TPR) repeat protein